MAEKKSYYKKKGEFKPKVEYKPKRGKLAPLMSEEEKQFWFMVHDSRFMFQGIKR